MKNNIVDEVALQEIKTACAEIISKRENMLEEHSFLWMARLLYRKCKLHILLAVGSLCILFWALYHVPTTINYIFIYLYMGVLGSSAIIELCKDYEYHVGELYMPTRIGGARLMSYTLVILSFIQILCLFIVIGCGAYYYALDFYKILWLTIIPCLFVNGITLQVMTYFRTFKSSIASYFFLYVLYYGMFPILLPYITMEFISIFMVIAVLGYYIKCSVHFQKYMNQKGGYLLWN